MKAETYNRLMEMINYLEKEMPEEGDQERDILDNLQHETDKVKKVE